MKEVLFSICVTAMLTAVYKALVPADRFGAQIKLLVACFFTVSVINAMCGVVPFWDISEITDTDTSYNDYSVRFRELTADETAGNLRKAISEKLGEHGITPEKIYIDVDISDNGSISISEIKLVFVQKEYGLYAEKAIVLARSVVGTKTKISAECDTRTKKER